MIYNDISIAINTNQPLANTAEELYQSYKESKKTNPRISAIITILGAGASLPLFFFTPLSFSACLIIGLAGASISLLAVKIFENLRKPINPKEIEKLLNQFYTNQKNLIIAQEEHLIQLNTQLNKWNNDKEEIEQAIEKNHKIRKQYEKLPLWKETHSLVQKKSNNIEDYKTQESWIKCREIILDELTQEPHASLINLLKSFEMHFQDQPELSLQSFCDKDSFKPSSPNLLAAYINIYSTQVMLHHVQMAEMDKKREAEIMLGLSDFLKTNVRDCEFSPEQLQLFIKNIPLDCPLSTASENYKNHYLSQKLSFSGIQNRILDLCIVNIESVKKELSVKTKLLEKTLFEIEKVQKEIQSTENRLNNLKNESFKLPL